MKTFSVQVWYQTAEDSKAKRYSSPEFGSMLFTDDIEEFRQKLLAGFLRSQAGPFPFQAGDRLLYILREIPAPQPKGAAK